MGAVTCVNFVDTDQIERARQVNVLDYILANEPTNIRRVGSGYRLIDHPSLAVTDGKWYWHSREIGGKTALDYLTDVRGYGLVDAVCLLINEEPAARTATSNRSPKKLRTPQPRPPPVTHKKPEPTRLPFALPLRNRDNSRAIEYLQSRGIDKPSIMSCIEQGVLFESAYYHNCVFLGKDERGKTRYATMRGATGNFKREADGSDKRYGFVLPPDNPNSKSVAVFESPIDCLSHQTLCKQDSIPPYDGWRLSLGGTSLLALQYFLETHSDVTHCVVCTDNDEKGNSVAVKVAELHGITSNRLPPEQGKDWNEALQFLGKEVNILEDKRKDIRFITPDYKTLFTVKDGDNVKFINGADGKETICKCRFVDETHLHIIGKDIDYRYHICELAEISELNGNRYKQIPDQKPTLIILSAKYGEPLREVEIPMTDAAIKRLVGAEPATEELRGGHVLLHGKKSAAAFKIENGVYTTLHPYWAKQIIRDTGVVEPPAQPTTRTSLHDKLSNAKGKVAEQNTVSDGKTKKQSERA